MPSTHVILEVEGPHKLAVCLSQTAFDFLAFKATRFQAQYGRELSHFELNANTYGRAATTRDDALFDETSRVELTLGQGEMLPLDPISHDGLRLIRCQRHRPTHAAEGFRFAFVRNGTPHYTVLFSIGDVICNPTARLTRADALGDDAAAMQALRDCKELLEAIRRDLLD